MPRHDFPPPTRRRDVGGRSFTPGFAYLAWVDERRWKRKRSKDMDEGGVPAEPDRPRGLSGGAAAPLDFSDE